PKRECESRRDSPTLRRLFKTRMRIPGAPRLAHVGQIIVLPQSATPLGILCCDIYGSVLLSLARRCSENNGLGGGWFVFGVGAVSRLLASGAAVAVLGRRAQAVGERRRIGDLATPIAHGILDRGESQGHA